MQNNADKQATSWLSYASLSDGYQRKARFLPGLLSILVLIPPAAAFGAPLDGFFQIVAGGLDLGAVLAIGLSHLASATGNRIQRRLWPRWPHDSPTNRLLHPDDNSRSQQQKSVWYAAIKRLTDLDIPAARVSGDKNEIEPIVNDAVTALRYRLRNSKHADRLNVHNIDFGFARNLTGLRPFWMTFSFLSCLACWAGYLYFNKDIIWGIISFAVLSFSLPIGFIILPRYVRHKAQNYADSFVGAMMELDRSTVVNVL